MARSRRGQIDWYSPDPRAILPLDQFRVSRSLAKRVAAETFDVSKDAAFEQVIEACAAPRPDAPDTWINAQVIETFTELHKQGVAHSVEAWSCAGASGGASGGGGLVGGLYGVALGGVFFGESMFSRQTDASKVCLVHLVAHLSQQGFALLDVQFSTAHLRQFGVEEIPRHVYLRRLADALDLNVGW